MVHVEPAVRWHPGIWNWEQVDSLNESCYAVSGYPSYLELEAPTIRTPVCSIDGPGSVSSANVEDVLWVLANRAAEEVVRLVGVHH